MVNNVLEHKSAKNEIFRFILSAGTGALVDVSAFYLFYHNLLVQHTYQLLSFTIRNSTISLAMSFSMGVVVNFFITKYLVFNESKLKASRQFGRFILVAIVGFFANLAIVKLMIQSFDVYPPVARIIAILSLFFASYFIHKVFSFNLSLRNAA